MFTLYKKELNYYLNNPIGYIVITLFAVFANFLFIKDIFLVGSASMRPFFGILPWLMMVFVPALAMRSIAEEKRINTIETLLTLPLSETQIVLAKFAALVTLVKISLVLTFGLPISLYTLTYSLPAKLYLPEILMGYIGLTFLACMLIAISMFFSSQTKNQVIAFLLSVVTIFFMLVLSTEFMNVLPRFILDMLVYFSPFTHVQNFMKGLLDIRSVFYFLSFTIIFLVLTIVDLEKRA